MLGNLAEKMELDSNISQKKMLTYSHNMRNSQRLEDASTCTVVTEASAHVSNTERTANETVDSDHATALDDDWAIEENLAAGTTCYRSKKNSTTAKKLSKMLRISQEMVQRTIDNTTQRFVR